MIRVPTGDLHTAVKAVLTTVSKDVHRPHLNAMQFVVEDEEERAWLVLVGTDGHRLTRIALPLFPKAAYSWEPVLVTREEVERLEMNLRKQAADEALELKQTKAGLVVGRFGTFLRTDEAFPRYQQVMPKRVAKLANAVPVALQPQYLADAARVFIDVYGKAGTMVVNPVKDGEAPQRYDSAAHHPIQTTVVIMPKRV